MLNNSSLSSTAQRCLSEIWLAVSHSQMIRKCIGQSNAASAMLWEELL